jgi:hypothetical protein
MKAYTDGFVNNFWEIADTLKPVSGLWALDLEILPVIAFQML